MTYKGLIVLSLFDGMSCGQIALKEIGIKVDKYYASEVDKFAIEQTQLNFPDTIHLGDVTKWKEWNIDWGSIDLVIGGSPCQGFSMAGKQLAFDDPRSVLFFEFVDIVNHVKKNNPSMKFLLENVQMAKQHIKVINNYMGIHPVEINSSLVSAQNRVRLYWSNIRVKEVGLFGEKHTDIPQPKDRDIYLKDILEEEVGNKYYLSDKAINGLMQHKERDKERGNGFGADVRHPEDKSQTVIAGGKGVYDLIFQLPRGYNKGGAFKDKTPTLSACSWENNNVLVKGVNQIGNIKSSSSFDNPQTGRVYGTNGKSPTLNTCGGGQREPKIVVDINTYKTPKVVANTGEKFEQESRVFSVNGKSPTILSNNPQDKSKILEGRKIRRLTPTECSRLQTVPDWYKWECSDTQQYKMLGNGWTIEVIKHIFKYL